MPIIPIDPNQLLTHTDEDGSEFYFRYLTGEYREKFSRVNSFLVNKASKYLEIAKKEIGKKAEGKDIATRAISLAKKAGVITEEDENRNTSDIIDIFLVGWKGKKFPKLAKDRKPSDYLTPVALSGIMGILSEHLEELLGLSVDDLKN